MSSHFTVDLVNIRDFQQGSLLTFGWVSSLSRINPALLNAQHTRFLKLNARSSSLPSSAPPLPHQPSHLRTRYALPSFPNAFLSRNAPSRKQLYAFFETYLRSHLLGEPCLIPQLLTDLSVSISLDLQNPTHISYSHCFLFSHWAGSFSRKRSSLHPQYLGYNRHSVSIYRKSERVCFPWYIVICFSSLFACFISVYPFFSNRLIDI